MFGGSRGKGENSSPLTIHEYLKVKSVVGVKVFKSEIDYKVLNEA